MAINDNILAQKLAKPRRQPRSGPIVSEDGATHYRVFDEPRETVALEETLPNSRQTKGADLSSIPDQFRRDDHVVISNQARVVEPISAKPDDHIVISNQMKVVEPISAQLDDHIVISNQVKVVEPISEKRDHPTNLMSERTPGPLEAELKISGVAFEVLNFLIDSVQDVNTGITAPIIFQDLQKISSASKENLRKTIQRLEKREIIARVKFKGGTGGWTQYRICDYPNLVSILKNS